MIENGGNGIKLNENEREKLIKKSKLMIISFFLFRGADCFFFFFAPSVHSISIKKCPKNRKLQRENDAFSTIKSKKRGRKQRKNAFLNEKITKKRERERDLI
eukprot:TRINITY_DN1473_c1_g1_i7.p2 TRINITY_DN1473_c1_g1~~TRINITY_DN1473_c1_g1_i7.p2  ORF type:complete len:102 (-),score=22.57 TRINITY_DN1473_c1_g1_i7:250-555(-)